LAALTSPSHPSCQLSAVSSQHERGQLLPLRDPLKFCRFKGVTCVRLTLCF
jgi:hypothetical protein